MSYNISAYNHSPFNLSGSSGDALYISAEGFENINSLAGVGQDFFLFLIFAEHVYTELKPSRLIVLSVPDDPEKEPKEKIGFLIDPIGEYWLSISGSESVSCENDSSAAFYLENEVIEEINGEFDISSIMHTDGESDESVSASAEHHSILYIYPEGHEMVANVSDVEAFSETVCTLNVTIPPGGRLIMNSDTYLVLLNGENAVHVHEGGWFDKLTRQTVGFTIKANKGQAGLSARIMYTERYL